MWCSLVIKKRSCSPKWTVCLEPCWCKKSWMKESTIYFFCMSAGLPLSQFFSHCSVSMCSFIQILCLVCICFSYFCFMHSRKCTVLYHYQKKSPWWKQNNIILVEEKKNKIHSFPGTAARSIVLSASLLPDYVRAQHTQAPQSMPHAMLPLCTHIPRFAGVTPP